MSPEETTALVSKSFTITDCSPDVQEEWLVNIGKSLKAWGDFEDHVIMVQAQVLYHVWSIWDSTNNDEHRSLATEAKAAWRYDFYRWAKAYTKHRASREPQNITIDNKITTYRDWKALEVIEAPEIVYIPKRDDYGRLIQPDLTKDDAWEAVKFDPIDCDYGKLLVCRGAAKRREMSPESWSALRDPYATVNDLQTALAGDRTRRKNQDDNFYLKEEDGIIYCCGNGHRVAIFQTLYESATEDFELFRKGLCHIMRSSGLPVPVEFQL